MSNSIFKTLVKVRLPFAQIVDFEVLWMISRQEVDDVFHPIAIQSLRSRRRFRHCDDSRSDICQVEVKPILLESRFVERYGLTESEHDDENLNGGAREAAPRGTL